MKITKKIFTGFIFTLILAASAHAAGKWETLIFPEDINMGLIELDRYCLLHDISIADVLWANSIASSEDIQAGTSIYLPANQADMLAIWQNQGAWKPTALVPVTSAATAKKIAVEHEKKVEAKKKKDLAPILTKEENLIDPKESAEIQAKLEEFMKTAEAPKIETVSVEKQAEKIPQPVQTVQAQTQTDKYQDFIREIKVERAEKQETPQEAIARMAKPDTILTEKPKKTASTSASDPIIVLSPNGDSSQGPMRLLIVGDKVEVVRIPDNAVPKTLSVADLDHVFGTTPSYLPYYNMTEKPGNKNYTINFRNLSGKMMWPVEGKVSSYFGQRGGRKHEGIDIPMPEGTPIRAARNGIVARTGNNSTMGFRGYGNFVLLDHGNGLQSFYAHCSKVAVTQGQRIMQGQIVGYVGCTGRSTANHLHFEVRVNNAKVDPMPYLAGNTHLASNNRKNKP